MSGKTAICYLLAEPAPERPIEAVRRRLRSAARRIPFLDRLVDPVWSPSRRLGFAAGLRASVQSLRKQHRELPPVILLQPRDQLPPLADVDEIITLDPAHYASITPSSSYMGREVYYKLEVFNLRGYDRIVYLDCDTVVLDDISPLWDTESFAERGLYAVRETPEMGAHPFRVGKFNLGVMLVNRPILDGQVYDQLLSIARRGECLDGEQGVFERYLSEVPDEKVGELDDWYNVMVVAKRDGDWDRFRSRIKILHYVNRVKPWAADHHRDPHFDGQFKRVWDDAYRMDLSTATAESPARNAAIDS